MIREAEPDDIDELYDLWRELVDFHQGHHPVFKVKPNSEEALKKELVARMKARDSKIFAFVQGSEWLGFIFASFKVAAAGFQLSQKGYIGETVVTAKHRGTGVGKELFETARKWLTDRGADHIELQVSVKNGAGLGFWEAQGFAPSTFHLVLELKK